VEDGSAAFGRALDGFESVLVRVPDDGWNAPTPCDPWTVCDIAGHTIGGLRWAAALLSGSEGVDVLRADGFSSPGSLAHPDPVTAWGAARSDIEGVIAATDPAFLIAWPFGERSVDTGLAWFSLEPLVHTWDLAAASAIDVRLDPELVHEHLVRLMPLSAYLRGAGGYGPEADAPPGADEQDQLLAFLGRMVMAWNSTTRA
jgi:uncharacterized protein (TIGR03086 family)